MLLFNIAVLVGSIGLIVFGAQLGENVFALSFYLTIAGVVGLAITAALVTIRAILPSRSANVIA